MAEKLPPVLLALHACELREKHGEIERLARENERLRAQLREMELFLADYGLEWVGGERGAAAGDASSPRGATPAAGGAPPHIDLVRVRARVEELNALAGDGSSMVATLAAPGAVSRLTPIEPLPLTFWQNGMQVGDHPVREYVDVEVGVFLADLLDGYFPYELRHAFPEGTPFEVRDRLGDRLGAGRGAAAPHDWGAGRSLRAHAHAPCAAALARASLHVAAAPSAQSAEAPGDARRGGLPMEDARVRGAAAPRESEVSVLLQVRGIDGEPLCQLCLPADAPLGELRAAIAHSAALPARAWPAFELRTTFPNRSYGTELDGEPIGALGFAPTATLHLHALPALPQRPQHGAHVGDQGADGSGARLAQFHAHAARRSSAPYVGALGEPERAPGKPQRMSATTKEGVQSATQPATERARRLQPVRPGRWQSVSARTRKLRGF
ncbi:hypothetical protein KFE25_014119 [Diacronema lutheri]|uniref:SEP domain-containing protein n=1 Tax=Diacronema lutheri TaxID=2081491 RepID=A0A8J5XEJ9_DIALT|nr:hypothetical protein KFE25_014119 [Diacronema lutheri]